MASSSSNARYPLRSAATDRGLRGAVDDEEDRGAEPFGDLSGAAALVVVVAVEEGLAALDDGDVGVGGEAGDAREVVLAAQHPPVEVERGAPGGGLVEERVEQVGANLETLHAETALAKRRHQTHREGGLTHASLRAGDDDDLHRRASSSRAKSIRNPSTRLRLTLHLPSSFDREYPRYRGAGSLTSRFARAEGRPADARDVTRRARALTTPFSSRLAT